MTESGPGPGQEPTRREFFRRFAGDLVASAAQLSKVVGELRDESAAEARSLLADGGLLPITDASTVPAAPPSATSAATSEAPAPGEARPATGFRTPFRMLDDDTLLLIDQRRLPDVLVEVPVKNAAETAAAIRDMVVRGAPAIGQVAAIGLALSARSMRLAQPYARRAVLETGAEVLRGARPTAINLGGAVDRLMARSASFGELSEDGAGFAAALWDEAMAIVAEATDAGGRMAELGLELLPRPAGRPLEILTHCNTGPLAAGQFGTALGVVQAAHFAERPIHVWVDETRPYLQGARLTTWELAQAGVDHTLLPDGAAASLLAAGRVDAILVGADRVAANGDTGNKVGTYPLAVLAARHGVPFYVVAPTSSIDQGTPDGSAIPIEERSADEVVTVRGIRIAPAGTKVFNPAFDVTPAELVTAIVTERGILRPPYREAIAAAMAGSEASARSPRPREA
ncbi:MAG TPA: S-methyl-5-thioribose-1-phosphate isomerase [Candidatus Limnocylindrales bacterium]|nr:S-methyl-5-thioribose-1-phosphate isomerase [Candidatus Limnocylindrales bacterium]